MALTYASYLRLDELLKLQVPESEPPEHDEMLFIVIHQAYEVWFKQVLHELDHLVVLLDGNDLARSRHTLRRVRTIMKLLVSQVDVLETMTPMEFLSFRDRLESASGFQSAQFRELEYLLGFKQRRVMEPFAKGSEARRKLEARFAAPTLWDIFMRFLARQGHAVPAEVLNRDVTKVVLSSPKLQDVLYQIYQDDPSLADFCELLSDLDEGLQEWRYRHVKMVERTIGSRAGTGGSSGVDYLRGTLFKPCFPDLWKFRSLPG
ncbi:MAG: tryptophan 2,3-dioxygenase family protein [Planctomycetota bacterium]